jgi:hypothetical protein
MVGLDPGKWYLAVECRNSRCLRAIIVCEAPDDPEERVAIDEELQLECQHCGHKGSYRPFDLRRIQEPERL